MLRLLEEKIATPLGGFAPIFPDTCYHLTHYWPAAADIPVASDNPVADVTPDMTAFRQELFGPVAAITVAKDAAHALALANDSEFGLSATIFTADDTLAAEMAARLECGGVFINGYSASDARVAFGGVKKSGFGRELSHFGLHEFCNVQTVWKNRV